MKKSDEHTMRSLAGLCLWLLGLIISMTCPASAGERHKIIVGGDHQNPPYEFLENGRPTGFNLELIRAAAAATGMEVEFRLAAWDKVRKELEEGQIDALAGMYYSSARSRLVEFSLPHTLVSVGLFVRRDSPIRSFDDIRGKEIIVQKGDIIDDYLREQGITSRIAQVTDPGDELRLLASGGRDCALMPSRFQGEYLKRSLGLTGIRAVEVELPQLRYCFAVQKGNDALRNRLDEGLNILKVNGGYKAIYEKWFGAYEERTLWQTVRYFVWGLALVALLLAASMIWSWSLRRRVRTGTQELRESEEKFRVLAETSPAGIWLYQGERIVYVNPATTRLLEYTEEECLAMNYWEWVHPDFRDIVRERGMARQRGEPVPAQFECKHLTKGGKEKWALISAGLVDYRGKPAGIVTMFDISERKRMEDELLHAYDGLEKRVEERTAELAETVAALEQEIVEREKAEGALSHLNDILKTLVRCSEALAHADDEQDLMNNICRIITENSAYHHAWVGFGEDDPDKTVRAVASAGYAPGYLENLALTWADTARGRGPVGTAIREGTPSLFRDIRNDHRFTPWRDEAIRQGYASILSIPLFDGDRAMGALTINASAQNAFDEEEVNLMTQLARDLSYGIRSLRTAAERRRVEESLRLSQFCIDSAAIGIYQTDENGTIFSANDYACSILGYSKEELYSLNVFDIDSAITREKMLKLKEMLAESGSVTHETIHRRKDGTTFPVEIVANHLEYQGKIFAFSFVKDISERKRAEEALREANLVVENSPAVLFRWNSDDSWPVELVSGNVIQFGYQADEFLSGAITYSAIIHPEDLDRVTRAVRDYCDEGADQFRLEYRILTKGGDIRWVHEHTNVERNQTGCISNYQGIIIDVTDQKLIEEELQHQKLLLEELNRTLEERVRDEVAKNREKDLMLIQQNRQAALGEILDHIAHQWRQPLNVISLITFLLKDKEPLNMEEVNQTADKILGQVEHMSQTIDVFRDFYRPDKEKSLFLVKEGIERAISFILPALKIESVQVEVEADSGMTALGYPKEFAQVILNIASNARDAFRERSVEKRRLTIRAFGQDNWAVVTVTDNAGGISAGSIASIFDMNFTTKQHSGGSGVGLYMSKHIIERHMGGLLTAGNVADGARFTIKLPITGLGQ